MTLLRVRRSAALLFAGVLTASTLEVGCGGSSPASPTAPSPTPRPVIDGTWSGTTGHGLPVSFTVQNSVVTRFSITLLFEFRDLPGSPSCQQLLEGTPNALVQNGAFRFALSAAGMRTQFEATTSSASDASGTYGFITLTNFRCGALQINSGGYLREPQTFSAKKQG